MKKLIPASLIILLFSCNTPNPEAQIIQLTNLEGEEDQLTFSPKGDQIAFTYALGGNRDIYIQTIDEKEELLKVAGSKDQEHSPAWSPDGEKLVYTVENNAKTLIRIHNLSNNELKNIELDSGRAFKANWSPNGQQIVFAGHDGRSEDIYLYHLETEAIQKLTDEPGREAHFGFSPDGRYIGYNKRGGPEEDLFAISVDGKEKINITQHADYEWYPHWSPQGDGVLFYSTWGDAMTEVWIASFPTHGLKQVSNHIVEDFGSVFSPDGKEVVFISKRDGMNDLFIYHLEKDITRKLGISEKLKRGWPKWSPAGQALAYSANVEEPFLYEVNIESRQTQRITNLHQAEEFPTVDPKGKYLAFVTNGNGSESNIMLFDLETKKTTPFLNNYQLQTRPQFSKTSGTLGMVQGPGGSVATNNIFTATLDEKDSLYLTDSGGIRHFVWTPDDQEVIYGYDSSANYSFDIWKKNLSTGKIQPLVQTTGSEIPTSVSPDGTHFLFQSNISGQNKVYQLPFSGTVRNIESYELTDGWDATYSPDGEHIVFISNKNEENTTDIFIMDKNAQNKQRLTNDHFEETHPQWSADGKRIIFSAQKGSKDIYLYTFK